MNNLQPEFRAEISALTAQSDHLITPMEKISDGEKQKGDVIDPERNGCPEFIFRLLT